MTGDLTQPNRLWLPLAGMIAVFMACPAWAQEPDIQRYASPQQQAAGLPFSAMVAHGNTLYLAGAIGFEPDTGELGEGVSRQTTLALNSIESVLAQAGADRAHLLNCIVFLADMNDYAAMNTAFATFFGDDLPARTTVAVTPPLNAALEISCVAARPQAETTEE